MKHDSYQLVRVISPETNRPTTISIDHGLFIQACRYIRCLKAVMALVRKLAREIELVPGESFSGQVAGALARHIATLQAAHENQAAT